MTRSKTWSTLAAAAVALWPVALSGDVNRWTTHGPNARVNAIAADPADPRTVYAVSSSPPDIGPGAVLFKTLDGGGSWQALDLGPFSLENLGSLIADPLHPTTLYAGTWNGTVLKSVDGGAGWDSHIILPAKCCAPVLSLALDTTDGAVFAGFSSLNRESSSVSKSADGGESWSATGLEKPRAVYALLADSMNQTIFAGTDLGYEDDGFSYIYGFGGAVARTTDGGANWALSATDLGSPVTALASREDEGSLYAGTTEGAVYRSIDGGVNWNLGGSLCSISTLVADPVISGALYAATNCGVFRSRDRGASWKSFNAGMGPHGVTSLTIDSTGTILHAGTVDGVFDIAIESPHQLDPCAPAPDHLCLLGGRFQVELNAVEPFTGTGTAARSVPVDDRYGYFSLPALTGDPMLPEVLVKMVDATSLPGGGNWFFYGSMTSVAYTLTITDTTTGQSREYSSDSLCGGADALGSLVSGPWDYAAHPLGMPAAPLQSSGPELALLSGRFRISLTARNPATGTETAGAAIAQADRFGYFSLPAFTGDPRLPEVFVKMIEGTDGNVLFFHAPLTSLPYTLTIVDSVSGRERTYVNDPVRLDRICGGDDVLVLPK